MLHYERGQHLGRMDFSPAAVVSDFQRLAGKVTPWLPDFSDRDRIRLRQELAIVEALVDRMAGRAAVSRAIAGPARRIHPLFPDSPPPTPDSMYDAPTWRGLRRAGSRKAAV